MKYYEWKGGCLDCWVEECKSSIMDSLEQSKSNISLFTKSSIYCSLLVTQHVIKKLWEYIKGKNWKRKKKIWYGYHGELLQQEMKTFCFRPKRQAYFDIKNIFVTYWNETRYHLLPQKVFSSPSFSDKCCKKVFDWFDTEHRFIEDCFAEFRTVNFWQLFWRAERCSDAPIFST